MLTLPNAWIEQFEGRDVFEQIFALDGEVYREQPGRKTLRFAFQGRHYFAKIHGGIGVKEMIKNLLQFRLPVLGAENEWRAIQRLEQLGINTTPLLGYGKRGRNPVQIQSFVITEELPHSESLEDFCRDWSDSPPDHALKRALITQVAEIARTVHEHGLNHRDFYICHLRLDISSGMDCPDPRKLKIYLIDLHRMQIRRSISRRSRLKDLAALYFSSMDIGLTERDLLRFVRVYRDQPLRKSLSKDRFFWWQVKRRANALHRKYQRKYPEALQ
ncbi:MAG: lipopolysaccharide core heptose(I) kinase RfaP [Deltaproteobacteria bacterium]|nr:lipopolysaccharide core heptose(I) kinase RfaP [Deltaproteobacteria bacterium]